MHRTLAFIRHLVDCGWDVSVLTTSVKAYDNWSEQQYDFIPDKVNVIRAYARNVARHFSIKGKYLGAMALPDNWQSWIIGGVIRGLWSVMGKRPSIIVSTYPIASAHMIGYLLHRITGIPWVVDLRDPMAQADYPSDPKRKKWFEWIERKVVKHAKVAIVTTLGTKRFYQDKFPDVAEDFWHVIPNGYDEAMFDDVVPQLSQENGKLVLLHSGLIYPNERDPSDLFAAIAALKQQGKIDAQGFELRLRATGHDDHYRQQLSDLNIEDVVTLAPTVPYKQALQEMLSVDALLLLQAANCNYQIPAKAYEYIRSGKPVLALTPEEGDTGQLLAGAGVAQIAPLDNAEQIETALVQFIDGIRGGNVPHLDEQTLYGYSRQYQAKAMESLLVSSL
ncbi:glycosyltransferase [Aestuariibacter halophilus]|uniref:Glycosyltransferase n=1 Tax=Fluctibacter halophilus TaxID=226011 RepID=A0ABS8G2S2_9ALTE|nr:glycosyltransferase [Aestuariibacter halophilus]MCC2614870.1 glycosyltransferase [Aestuariibacter halophilus]